jgi:hypothetical protein
METLKKKKVVSVFKSMELRIVQIINQQGNAKIKIEKVFNQIKK